MVLGLSIALGLVIVACFVLLDRKDKRWTETVTALVTVHQDTVATLLELHHQERIAHREEIQVLCNRLQAPKQAVMQSLVEQAGPDEDRPLTDEEMVDFAEQQAAIARLEQLENNGLDGLLR